MIWVFCFECGKAIPDGLSMWSINFYLEVCVAEEISVLETDRLFIFREECAKHKNFSGIDVPKRTTYQ